MGEKGNGDSGWATLAKVAIGFALGAIVSNETLRKNVVGGVTRTTTAVRDKVSEWKRKHDAEKTATDAIAEEVHSGDGSSGDHSGSTP